MPLFFLKKKYGEISGDFVSCFGHDPNRIYLEILKNDRNLMAKFQLEISPYFFSGKKVGLVKSLPGLGPLSATGPLTTEGMECHLSKHIWDGSAFGTAMVDPSAPIDPSQLTQVSVRSLTRFEWLI